MSNQPQDVANTSDTCSPPDSPLHPLAGRVPIFDPVVRLLDSEVHLYTQLLIVRLTDTNQKGSYDVMSSGQQSGQRDEIPEAHEVARNHWFGDRC